MYAESFPQIKAAKVIFVLKISNNKKTVPKGSEIFSMTNLGVYAQGENLRKIKGNNKADLRLMNIEALLEVTKNI